ncbi:MAG: hypothetical protein H7Z39_04210 [Burkholderiaceae bacterium]|nr:hypothetical protein [Burkholderiaceae bacterium]
MYYGVSPAYLALQNPRSLTRTMRRSYRHPALGTGPLGMHWLKHVR